MKKFEIDAEINEGDFNTIIEALNFWEMQIGVELEMIKKLKMFPEPEFPDEESKEAFYAWKNAAISREKELKKAVRIRMEKAILLKAKLLLMNQTRACNEFLSGEV